MDASAAGGYRPFMAAAPRDDERDVAVVVGLLRRSGPCPFAGLCDVLEQDHWSRDRVEHAVIEAWAQSQLSVDREDRLVAL